MNDTVSASALPYALPRSALPGAIWPALPDDAASRLLALQLQLEQSQWWPAERLEARQLEQLRLLLAHARDTTAFYRARLDEAGIDPGVPLDRDGWSRIPVLTRRDVQRFGEALRSNDVPPEHGAIGQSTTSGSTGRAITISATELHMTMWQALTLREHFWHRRDLAGRLAAIRSRGSEREPPPDGLALPGWGPATDLVFQTGPSAILSHSRGTAEQAAWLLKQDPDYLLTTPTNALALARHFRRNGLRLPRLREVRTYGEALPAELRDACREAWGVRVTDMYSAREIGYMALQCPLREHYHVQSENVLLEVLDENGAPCAPGEIGRVVVTQLHNYATPLIRYEIGDCAEVGAGCPCGRGLPVLARIAGRVRNMLRSPDGTTRWPDFMLAKARTDLPLAQIQVVQTAPDALELRAVPEGELSASDLARLLDYIRGWAGPQFKAEVRVVDAIARGAGGKFEEFLSLLEDVR